MTTYRRYRPFILFTAFILLTIVLFFQLAGKKTHPPGKYPNDWAMRQRIFPTGKVDKKAALQAVQAAQQQRMHVLKSQTAIAEWEFVGPTNIGGRISDIEYNPTDPHIVYAGAATGGVFRSNDGGSSWQPIFDEQAVLPIGDIAIDPAQPRTIYVGTGEANGGHNNFPGGGIFKSIDGGQSWQHAGLTETTSISRIVVNPLQPNIVYAAAIGSYFSPDPHRGVYKSDDGGQNWRKVLFLSDSAGVIDLVIHPQKPNILFAAGWHRIRPATGDVTFTGANSAVFKSVDGGFSWEKLGQNSGLPAPDVSIGRIGLTICTEQPDHLYALYSDGFYHYGLYRTRDGGATWSRTDQFRGLRSGTGNLSWYLGQVRVAPDNPEKVFVLDVGLMGSEDGGQTWPIFHLGGFGSPHVDHHALAFHPEKPNHILNGNDGGIYLSTNAGRNWKKAPELPITQFYHISHDPSNPERVFGGTQDNGTVRTLTGGGNDWDHILGGDGFYVLIDPTDPETIYAESQFGGLAKTRDGGQSWRVVLNGISVSEPTNWSTPILMDAQNSHILYYGTTRIYKTWDGGESWHAISSALGNSSSATVTTIAPSPTDSAVVYAGTEDGQVWITRDAGGSWLNITNDLPLRWVTRLRVDPLDAEIAYVTFSGLKWDSPLPHVFRTGNGGATWTDISNNLPDAPVNSILVDPVDRNALYVATDIGVYFSGNRGGAWQAFGRGMPMVSVYDLDIDQTNRYLLAGTHGRSIYRIQLGSTTGIADNPHPQNLTNFELAQNYPNPFNAETQIRVSLLRDEHVSLDIYAANGQHVAQVVHQKLAAGQHTFNWSGKTSADKAAPSGVYFYRLTTATGQAATRRMILLK
ncbi:T9SS type A sorting domain-containing protein [candidate division KSB1 bacterium]|nr:T9SS type A sorting domain-containing protein [candidate division KSB1 bacterium]